MHTYDYTLPYSIKLFGEPVDTGLCFCISPHGIDGHTLLTGNGLVVYYLVTVRIMYVEELIGCVYLYDGLLEQFIHEGRLQISWTQLVFPSRNFVEMC
jgi:hypothetical protein